MTGETVSSVNEPAATIVSLLWNTDSWTFEFAVNVWVVGLAVLVPIAVIAFRLINGGSALTDFEIDQADIGIGDQKFTLKPNSTDRQVAYAIWVELSTRKLGLQIDFDNDVISEVYDSWYGFFSVTRELVKDVPVQKVKRDSTQKIIRLSVKVLNSGLRPHLTKWQARFRHWYDRELRRYDEGDGKEVLDPQMIQATFPQYEELKADMERVNRTLIKYRRQMHKLVLKD